LNQLPPSVVDAASINRNLDNFWKDMGIKSYLLSPSSFKIQDSRNLEIRKYLFCSW